MTTWSQRVFSSNVEEIGYNAETEELIVTWKSGKQSAYAGVPEGLAQEVANAPSVGQALNSMIKPQYAHRYL